MREIKFRGKARRYGEWFYGNYYDRDTRGCTHIGNLNSGCLDIDPNTVGQYTGLKDKNGKEIYEGDIIQLRQPDGNCVLCEVSFCEKGYWAISFGINERVILGYINRNQIEVIGNIHDDPKFKEE